MLVLNYPLSLHEEFLGEMAYHKAIELMENTIAKASADRGWVWGLEHPLVYTSGLKTEKDHILDPNIEIVAARRGGSVTLHNPGQLVVYFVLPLAAILGGLERFVRVLEATIAELLLGYGVPVEFIPKASGVFTPRGKIAFIGLGLKKGFIYHGIAINICNRLEDYRAIHSCGLVLPVVNMAAFVAETPTTRKIFEDFALALRRRFFPLKPAEFRDYYHGCGSDWQRALILGGVFFHERRFWEAHEVWELAWHDLPPGELRVFLQGLIQLAMACYKIFSAPNTSGAVSLLHKAIEKLEKTSPGHWLQNADMVLDFARSARTELGRGGTVRVFPPTLLWQKKAFALSATHAVRQ
ncbi:MAG: lipoyl(octanoyl) transferase LipB [Turneriella sp.]|nr:lipoyl(octanoyl) transferase LipB [Turneriella sp.]